jgi:quinol monooxygenase YgiN
MFYENWDSRALWQDHMNSPHLKAFQAVSEGAIAEFTLYEMTPVG